MSEQIPKVMHLPINRAGRDFVVGDLHGELATLTAGLKQIGFDFAKDRLFSVGDLIDRGPESADCLRLIKLDWFHAVLGNHEGMMLDALKPPYKTGMWKSNGGGWWGDISDSDRQALEALAASLPHVIVVGEGEQRFNVLHAEHDGTDEQLSDGTFNSDAVLWGRSLIMTYHRSSVAKEYWPKQRLGLSPTFVGHTTLDGNEYFELESHVFLDTGATQTRFDKDGWLSIAELTPRTNQIQRVHKVWVVE